MSPMARLNYWIWKLRQRVKKNAPKLSLIFLIIILISMAFCRIVTEPGKVWNLRAKLVALTENLKGLPYRYGGYDIDGFDCSGLVYYVYDSFGIRLPRTAKNQWGMKKKVSLKHAEPGDILVFKLKHGRWHTAILTGRNSFIHAPNRNGIVRKEYLNDFWKDRLKSVIQILDPD